MTKGVEVIPGQSNTQDVKGEVINMIKDTGKTTEETAKEMNEWAESVTVVNDIAGEGWSEVEELDGVEKDEDEIIFERPIDKAMKGVNKKRLIKITAGVAIVSGGLFIINQLTKKDVSGLAGRVVKVAEKVDEVNE